LTQEEEADEAVVLASYPTLHILVLSGINALLMTTILRVSNLTKRYNSFTAVDRISFELKEGEIVSLLGPNGAGKTTTIQMLLSLVAPTSGDIEIFGKSLKHHREELLSLMNFSAPYSLLPYNLTPREALTVFSLLYGVRDHKEKVQSLLEEFNLMGLVDKKIGQLSSGEQMRLGVAKAFVNNPKLLLLDEPTASLDPPTARQLRSRILKLFQESGGAVLWTSHNMREVEAVSDRIIFLSRGRVMADDTPQNLKERFRQEDLEEIFITIAREPIGEPS
jgi:ABC-2 type transport system ATP-binding protein